MNAYLTSVIENVKKKHGNEPEFVQTVEEVFSSLEPVIEKHPEYEKVDLLNRMVEPERMFTFRVSWEDDRGQWHTNIGYRCQFNGALGPYKGGLRFQANVYPGIIKFLGFEQIFKNSLTGLPIGGGKGGADFDPAGKSDAEIMRFCQAYMQALYRYIGPDVDVPAGDMGVGGREIGYLFGEYRRLKGAWENGVLTGKGFSYGGSLIRPEATGYGAVYYLQNVLEHEGERIAGKTIACAGFGNVTWGICKKATQLGAKVVTLSGPDGYIYDPDGVATEEKIAYLVEMRSSGRNRVQDYAEKFGVEFFPGEKPWGVKADVVMPSAMQNDVHMEQAKQIAANGVKYYIEVANMPTTNDALRFLMEQPGMIVAPSKAVNAGGVATSALEMAQNSERLVWTAEEVDAQLHRIMNTIYQMSVDAAEEYLNGQENGRLCLLGSISIGNQSDVQGNGRIEVEVQYQIKPFIYWLPIGNSNGGGLCFEDELFAHDFNGYRGPVEGDRREEEEIVYITENGTRYHTDTGCVSLRISVQTVHSSRLSAMRNQSGGRYYPCERCRPSKSGVFFITRDGDRYHRGADCSSLKRTVRAVTLEEAVRMGRSACSKCS